MHLHKVALITGAAVRLGKFLAIGLANEGFHIALHCHNSRSEAEETRQEIQNLMDLVWEKNKKSKRRLCQVFYANLSNAMETESLWDEVIKMFGRVDLLLNSASVYQPGTFSIPNHASALSGQKQEEGIPDWLEQTMHTFMVNLFAPMILMKKMSAWVQSQADAGQNRKFPSSDFLIINILDNKIFQEQYEYFSYVLSKKALASATTMAAMEFAPMIRVNGICPGVILPAEDRPSEYLAYREKGIPLRRLGAPQNIVLAVLYLLKNTFLTSEILTVDGGENKSSGQFGQGRNFMLYQKTDRDKTENYEA